MKLEDLNGDTFDAVTTCDDLTLGARPELPAGFCVGRFVIINQLGKGGMGVVYKAYDPELDRRIAVKLLNVEPTREGETISKPRDRLMREAQALAKLNHPNVVSVHDVGTFDTGVYVAMEYIEGQTLRAWLKEKQHSVNEVLQVFVAAGQGLQAAHEQGIIHRDFKPDNVMVGGKNRVWILDFGLAKAAEYERDQSDHNTIPSRVALSEKSLLNIWLLPRVLMMQTNRKNCASGRLGA